MASDRTTHASARLKYEPCTVDDRIQRLRALREALGSITPVRAEQMLAELKQIRNEWDRELPSIT